MSRLPAKKSLSLNKKIRTDLRELSLSLSTKRDTSPAQDCQKYIRDPSTAEFALNCLSAALEHEQRVTEQRQADILRSRGEALLMLKRYAEAVAALERSLAYRPEDCDIGLLLLQAEDKQIQYARRVGRNFDQIDHLIDKRNQLATTLSRCREDPKKFDPTPSSNSKLYNKTDDRDAHPASLLLPSGKVLVSGGNSTSSSNTENYDPATPTAADARFALAANIAPIVHITSPAGGKNWFLSTPGVPYKELLAWTMLDGIRICQVDVDLPHSGDVDQAWQEIPAGDELPVICDVPATSHGDVILSLNGHATRYEEDDPGQNCFDIQGLPTSEIYGLGTCATPTAGALGLADAIIYAIGCHGELPVPGGCVSDADRSLDFLQTFLSRGACAYLANSGYGWGLKNGIELSERLAVLQTEELTPESDWPAQPYLTYDARLSGNSQHGVVWLGGSYTSESNWTPVTDKMASHNSDEVDAGPLLRKVLISPRAPRKPHRALDSSEINCPAWDAEINSIVLPTGEAIFNLASDELLASRQCYQDVELRIFYFNNPEDLSEGFDRQNLDFGTELVRSHWPVWTIEIENLQEPYKTSFHPTDSITRAEAIKLASLTDHESNTDWNWNWDFDDGTAVDINLENDVNPINPMTRGKLHVTILANSELHTTNVDRLSLTFDRTNDESPLYRDGNEVSKCTEKDINADGLTDLICRYSLQRKPDNQLYAIGIDHYRESSEFPSLAHASQDAQRFASVLSRLGYQSSVPQNGEATKARILTDLQRVASLASSEDTFVFYFSGHGVVDTNGELALIPFDGGSQAGALTLSEINKTLSLHPGRVYAIFDACFSGNSDIIRDFQAKDGGPIFLLASSPGEIAVESLTLNAGIFTHALLRYLSNINPDDDIDFIVLFRHASVETTRLAKSRHGVDQHPLPIPRLEFLKSHNNRNGCDVGKGLWINATDDHSDFDVFELAMVNKFID